MKKTVITLLALVAAALVNTSALAQQRLEYNPITKDIELVTAVEQQWVSAILKRDTTTLQTLLGNDYTLIGPDGKSYSKASDMAVVQSPEFKLDSLALQDLRVRIYTGGAVVTGVAIVKGKSKDTDVSGNYRFTDILEPRNNVWQAVTRQLTKVEDEEIGKGKAK